MNIIKLLLISFALILSACATDSVLLERANKIEIVKQPSSEYQLLGQVVIENKSRIITSGELLEKLKLEAASKFIQTELTLANIQSKEVVKSKPVSKRFSRCQPKDLSHLGKKEQLGLNSSPLPPKQCQTESQLSQKESRYLIVTADVLAKK